MRPSPLHLLIPCALAVLAASLSAQDARLLKQVFPRTGPNPSSDPGRFVAMGNHVYSSSTKGVIRYDKFGSDARYLWADAALEIAAAGSTIFFIGRNLGLYASDGTSYGTQFLDPRLTFSTPAALTPLGGRVLFTATDTLTGRELWISDGTIPGTTRLLDIRTGTGASAPRDLIAHGNAVYFVADDGVHGAELWRSDGTPAGTTRVTDLRAGAASPDIRHLRSDGSNLWFFANRTGRGREFELWKSDGTTLGTTAVSPATPHPTLVPFRGGVLGMQDRNGRSELWGSDGTPRGTLLLKDLGAASNTATGIEPAIVGGFAYFASPDRTGQGRLWRSDGTTAGTIALTSPGRLPRHGSIAASGTQAFFGGGLGTPRGVELWTSDGTAAGTREFLDIHPTGSSRPSALRALGNRIWMGADDGQHGHEPWTTDGTVGGTRLVANLANWEQTALTFSDSLVDDDRAWMLQEEGATARLWTTDGTTAGTRSVQVLGYRPGRFLMAGLGKAFFSAPQSATSQTASDLWVSDGTGAGTKLLKAKVGYASDMVDLGKVAVFGAGGYGHELWGTDGTAAGTKKLGQFVWTLRVRGSRFVRVGTRAWFLGTGGRLHITDGTAAGSKVVASTYGYIMQSAPIRVGRHVAFIAQGRKLVRTDGTVAGTSELTLNTTSRVLSPSMFAVEGRGVFLLDVDFSIRKSELWFSDFTSAGTRRLLSRQDFAITDATILRGRLLFYWWSQAAGAEPWVSDGTPNGTTLLKDIEPGPGYSGGLFGVSVGSRYAYFRATQDLRSGLWRTDGTRAGTVPLGPSARGLRNPWFHVGGRLVAMGTDRRLGYQPHVVDLFANHKPVGHGCASAALRVPTLTAIDPVLGGQLRLSLGSGHANQSAVVFLGLPTTGTRHVQLPGGCTIYPDLAQPFLPFTLRTNAAGNAQLSLPIPGLSVLNRARVYAQAAVGRTANAPLGTDLTPGVSLTLGR